jgi:hypothetical protein
MVCQHYGLNRYRPGEFGDAIIVLLDLSYMYMSGIPCGDSC